MLTQYLGWGQFRGGGIVHGPVVHSHAHKLNKKVRRLGVLCALSVSQMYATCDHAVGRLAR